MWQYLFDTDHLTLLEYASPTLLKHMAAQPAGSIAICVITVEEALRGRLGVLSKQQTSIQRVHAYARLQSTVSLIHRLPVIPFDNGCEQVYQSLRARRIRIGTQDLRIAATALQHSIPLITRNKSDFSKVPGLKTMDWSI